MKIHKMTGKKKYNPLCLKLIGLILIEISLQIWAQASAPALRRLLRHEKKQPLVWKEGSGAASRMVSR